MKKKLKIARQNGFIFIQILIITIKTYSNSSKINIQYFLKLQLPIINRQFSRILSQNKEYIQLIVMIELILFILHVVNGIYIILHIINIK